jgi:hypothetical protein
MTAPPAELSVARIRQALWEASDRPHTGGGPTALAGRLFHETAAGLLSGPASWKTALPEDRLDDWRALRRHAYERLLGPRLAAERAAVAESGREVLLLWQAITEFCQWLSELLLAAKESGWPVTKDWLAAETPLERTFQEPGWSRAVRVRGVADALVRDPRTGRWCVIEFKLGEAAGAVDLGQATLYQMLLGAAASDLALVRFLPERRESVLSAGDLEAAGRKLLDLIGRLAEVTPRPAGDEEDYRALGKRILAVFESFGLRAALVGEPAVGPTFVRYEVAPGRGVAVKKFMTRAEDLGVQLAQPTPMVHIEEGRLVVDVARKNRELVPFSRVVEALPALDPLFGSARVPLGADLNNRLHAISLGEADSPHMLVAGTAGSGKTEWLRCAIAALILSNTPETLRLVLMDPKRLAFHELAGSPFLWHEQALLYPPEGSPLEQLERLIDEMEARYRLFEQARTDDLASWIKRERRPMPRIVCVIDEFADLMAHRQLKKEFERSIVRLGAKARAAGIHLILATQHPDAKTVTPSLQANLSVRVCMKTATWQQSLVALKERGAERLLGNGDLLFSRGGPAWRYQAPYLAEAERRRIFSRRSAISASGLNAER